MSENRSDYSLVRQDVNAMLPVIVQNPLLKAISESTFNRFLTKPELKRVIGTIGIQTPNAKDDLIVEENVYDQAYQLQPVIIDATKSVTDVITYKDIQRTAERLGIDFTDPRDWQTTEQFNFCPPINLDKLINFRDYFWVDPDVVPQYICIRNQWIVIQGELSQMIANYLALDSNPAKIAAWTKIKDQLNLIYTVIPASQQFAFPDLDLVVNDPLHAPYVPTKLLTIDVAQYKPSNDWSVNNKWVHRNDLDDASSATVATLPIIEYDDTIVLTNWTFTKHVWQYRSSAAFPWEDTDAVPSKDELFAEKLSKTQFGDDWLGFQQHWKYIRANPPVPVVAQPLNAAKAVPPIIAVDNQQVFETNDKILVGKNVLRVYVDGVRQYGTYAEVDEGSIKFYEPQKAGAIVYLYTEVAAASDVGMETASPYDLNLVAYRLEEQQKHADNDYPMFDMVDVNGKSLHTSSSIFAYAEDSSYPVHPLLGKRIKYEPLARDYGFDVSLIGDNKSFMFYNDTKKGISSIWTPDTSGAKYVPGRVDAKRAPTADVTAPWEIPGPFMNNMGHECRDKLMFSELFVHFQSIVDQQVLTDAEIGTYGIVNKKSYRLNKHINLGSGGTIKEYNGNFANFVSSVISSEYSPLEVIAFAQAQYEAKLIEVRKQVEANLIDVLMNDTVAVQTDINASLLKVVLAALEQDAAQSKIYNDSGISLATPVQNFVATLPYIRMKKPVAPYALRDDKIGLLRLVHHDGHDRVSEMANSGTVLKALKASLTPVGVAPAQILGKLWYNLNDDAVYRFNGKKWDKIDPVQMALDVLLQVEKLLYAGAPTTAPTYDLEALRIANKAEFDDLLRIEYETYCKANAIADPYRGDYDATNPFTWNYGYTDVDGQDSGINAGPDNTSQRSQGVNIPYSPTLQSKWASRWEDIYQNVYGTIAPHLEPWVLQGFASKPTWWDELYAGTARRWSLLMWHNINDGIIPEGKAAASGVIGTGEKKQVTPVPVTSVQTSDDTIGGYAPDDLLPPYWPYDTRKDQNADYMNQAMLIDGFDFVRAKVSSNDFQFGTNGPKEMDWRRSIGFTYAQMKIAFKLDPVRFLDATFGEDLVRVQGLDICKRTSNVLSHSDVLFHGDADHNGVKQYFAGINQWYVQLFRYTALYGTGGSAQRVWTNWTTQLAYNVGGFLVDNTLTLNSARIDVSPNDYAVQMKVAKKVRDQWIDALYLTIDQAGSYRELPQGAGRDWKFNVGVRSPIIRDIPYYGVKKYRITADAATNTFTLVDPGLTLATTGWKLGTSIMLDLGINGILPNAVDDSTYYSIIPVTNTNSSDPNSGGMSARSFKLATDANDAIAGKAIPLLTSGSGTFYVAELMSTFYAFEATNTDNLWKHYVIDKDDVRTFSSTNNIVGLQNVVDFVDGYVAYLNDQGYTFNDSSVPEYDENDRLINWQYEIEATINYLYLQMGNLTTFTANSIGFQVGEVELNPFRNNLWIDHTVGVVSEFNNVMNTATQAFVYDRSGNKVPTRNYHILRQDQRTQFTTLSLQDDVLQSNITTDSYDPNNQMAGAHIFFDEYEHVILFNPKTISGEYMYDQFLGVAVPRLQAYFEKQTVVSKRPNVGGFVLNGSSLTQNFEYTVGNIAKYYDTFTVNENSNFVNHARAMLGYVPNASYFKGSNITPKSQFLFYKGMIKAKGTLASVEAFTNSAQAATTEIDEFWAYKAFEFGDKRTKQAYTINLTTDDTAANSLKFQFVPTPLSPSAQDFTKVAVSDSARWYNFPSQLNYLASIDKLFGMKAVGLYSANRSDAPIVPGMTVQPFMASTDARSINIDGVTKLRTMIAHGQAAGVSVLMVNNTAPTRVAVNSGTASAVIGLRQLSYIPGTNSIDVYVNGAITTNYTETTGNSITLNKATDGVVVVVKKTGTLVEGKHYVRRNSRTLELLNLDIDTGDIQVLTMKADYSDCVPVKIYDQKSQTVVADVAPWDPLSGYDNALLTQNIDRTDYVDPAQYNMNPDTTKVDNRKFWSNAAIGTTWKDTASYDYAPYDEVTLASNKQLADWGSLAEWSDPAVYQWVESTVAPADWDTANGTPRKEVYGRTRKMYDIKAFAMDAQGVPTLTMKVAVPFVDGDEVVLFGETLPTGLDTAMIYTVEVEGITATLKARDGSNLQVTDIGIGPYTITKAAYDDVWTKVSQVVQHYEMMNVDFVAGTLNLNNRITAPNEVAIFINGKYLQDGFVEVGNLGATFVTLDADVIAPYVDTSYLYQLTVLTKTGLLDGLPSEKPDDIDLTESVSQYYTSYPHSQVAHVMDQGELPQPLYYFWVRGLIDGNVKSVSMAQAEYLISHNDGAYMVCMHPVDINGSKYLDRLVVSGVHGTVTENDRYVLRLSKNSTMRDTVFNSAGELLNPVHSQWIMFRENQPNNIERALWDKVTSSIVGYDVNDPAVVVPSLDRSIYDAQHGTSTRFGLNNDQAFVDGARALETILAHLNSATIVYDGVDIDAFLSRYNFSSKDDIVATMKAIFMTFPAKYVNMLFFAVMNDALSDHTVDYSQGLMKTSMISLSGTYAMNVNGVQDE